ncbi:MAG TPA: DUF6629 family protein [Methylocystis sp.]|nr:DUF6629 family protein [Methylocystis sp.]
MCYSFEASVNAGACLAVVGAATVHKAWRHDRRMIGFAIFPLVFSLHQFSEAAVWWSVNHPFENAEAFRYVYTAIAFLAWPVLTPFAATLAETNPARKRVWTHLYRLGVALAAYLSIELAFADGIALTVYKHSLAYDPGFERPYWIVDLIYLACAVFPLIAFDNRALRAFGAAVFASFVWALVHNRPAWYSVWCMSAAAFSLIISFAIREGARSSVDEASASG